MVKDGEKIPFFAMPMNNRLIKAFILLAAVCGPLSGAYAASSAGPSHANVRNTIEELQEVNRKSAQSDQRVNNALQELKENRAPEQESKAPVKAPAQASIQQAAKPQPVTPALKSGGASGAKTGKASPATAKGFARFCEEKNTLIHKQYADGQAKANPPAKVAVKEQPEDASKMKLAGGVTVEGGGVPQSFDPLAPRKEVLPGSGRHTLSQMDKEDAPEMTVRYPMGNGTTARLAVNVNDETSPVYTPRQKDTGLNSAGLYFDVDMDKAIQLQLGGHHRSLYGDPIKGTDGPSDTGASVGLKVDF